MGPIISMMLFVTPFNASEVRLRLKVAEAFEQQAIYFQCL